MLAHIIGHFRKRSAREKNLIHAFASHRHRIVMRNRPATAAENFDVASTTFAQKIDNFREELDVPAIITRDTNRADVLLDGGARNVANRAMIAEINHLNPVPDKFEIDRIDRAVVPVTNRHSRENPYR